jgi:hypothetical protein
MHPLVHLGLPIPWGDRAFSTRIDVSGRDAGNGRPVAVSQAQGSWMTSRSDPDRRTGPDARFPAPAIVVLPSPNVVSAALRLAWHASLTG